MLTVPWTDLSGKLHWEASHRPPAGFCIVQSSIEVTRVNGNKLLPLAFLALAALAAGACRKQTAVTAPATQTIAPAAAQPAPTTGTDQMTGTVEVEDGRSEAEGGVLMDNQKSQTSTTATPKKTTTKAAPKKTKSKK